MNKIYCILLIFMLLCILIGINYFDNKINYITNSYYNISNSLNVLQSDIEYMQDDYTALWVTINNGGYTK